MTALSEKEVNSQILTDALDWQTQVMAMWASTREFPCLQAGSAGVDNILGMRFGCDPVRLAPDIRQSLNGVACAFKGLLRANVMVHHVLKSTKMVAESCLHVTDRRDVTHCSKERGPCKKFNSHLDTCQSNPSRWLVVGCSLPGPQLSSTHFPYPCDERMFRKLVSRFSAL